MSTPESGIAAPTVAASFTSRAEPADARAIRAAYRAVNGDVLRQRIDLGVAIFVAMGLSLLVIEREAYREQSNPVGGILLLQIALCAVGLVLTRWSRVRERLPAIGGALASALVGTVLVEDTVLGLAPAVISLGLMSILAATSALFPWGWRAQLTLSLVAVVGFGLLQWFAVLEPAGAHAHTGLLTVAVATVAGAFLLDRYRFAAFKRSSGLERVSRENQEEAEISAALVRVGHTLGSAVGESDVFDRVNRLIVELLGCDWSGTVVLDPERRVYRFVGVHGIAPEMRPDVDTLEFSEESVPLFREMGRRGMVEIEDASETDLMPPEFFDRFPVSAALIAPIILHDKVVGAVTNGYVEHRGPFRRRHRRITAGIAQATAIAVENQRLFQDLTRANRVKGDFVSTMSHELRTPVNVILGYARILEEGGAGELSSEQRDLATRIRRSSTQLGEMVDGILDLSKLESGAERMKLDWVDIDRFVDSLREDFQGEAQGASLELEWTNHLAGRRILTEGPHLRTIVHHLVQNAIKFTPDGVVRVEFAPSATSLIVTVSDSGIGIAPEDVDTIFEEFHQVDATDSREFGGVGLGLHIVRRLVDRLGGSISVVSEPGAGAVFTIEIPAQFARAHRA